MARTQPAPADGDAWAAERRLWLEGGAAYCELVHPRAVLALPGIGLMRGAEAGAAMRGNPGWDRVEMAEQTCLVGGATAALGYRASGKRPDGSAYEAYCTSTYHDAGDGWQLIQHQQSPIS